MAGLSCAISLASQGEEVILFESRDYPGGKMRQLPSSLGGIDSGPTVFTMKFVFEALFNKAGVSFDSEVGLQQVSSLARHAWDNTGTFDLYTDRTQTADAIGSFFDQKNAAGYEDFCRDSKSVFESLEEID